MGVGVRGRAGRRKRGQKEVHYTITLPSQRSLPLPTAATDTDPQNDSFFLGGGDGGGIPCSVN